MKNSDVFTFDTHFVDGLNENSSSSKLMSGFGWFGSNEWINFVSKEILNSFFVICLRQKDFLQFIWINVRLVQIFGKNLCYQ